ncbi:MAG: hypothetical protein AB2693_15630 [Candidatus Thiodiazotropha sp.]
MNIDREIYAELRSFDSVHYFPDNQAASFKVQFDQEIRFKGTWELALQAISIDCPSKESLNFAGQNLYIYSNIIDFSFVGGSLKPLLKRVSLGRPIRSGNRLIYQVNEADKGCCCSYYKPITTSHCLCVEVHIEDDNGKLANFSPGCEVTLSLHFRRTSEYSRN